MVRLAEVRERVKEAFEGAGWLDWLVVALFIAAGVLGGIAILAVSWLVTRV